MGTCAGLKFTFADVKGGDVNDLTPYLGAYAHLTGVREGLGDVLHVHSVKGDTDSCEMLGMDHNELAEGTFGPSVGAGVVFPQPGWWKVFVQAARGDDMLVGGFWVFVE